ncbi:MAG TPA: HNH endonuclease signature motif containing protein [Candidatus Acidoferrales bacterium]|nr:HNH endonuclease signature motif containing protein [Candidatus Acidoferrales bacterium]
MLESGEIISYREMCDAEHASLQRGMNYKHQGQESVLLMSVRSGAPYRDRVEDEGRVLVYEGHDVKKTQATDPKKIDQPMREPSGKLTQNGQFWEAAQRFQTGKADAETVRVYEKIKTGIWVFNGIFRLVDSWQEDSGGRKVFKFRLELDSRDRPREVRFASLEHQRFIPSSVKVEVWKRDGGRCVKCGSADNLHFDHVIPFSHGGTSLVAKNIQLLCARHNIEKRDKVE